ncbi:hypothetical protein Bbelb_436960 [Branchiostoma belcheri]|nr:hypothetical protein Bbelb_436960 [Branchiostoma belcheri]
MVREDYRAMVIPNCGLRRGHSWSSYGFGVVRIFQQAVAELTTDKDLREAFLSICAHFWFVRLPISIHPPTHGVYRADWLPAYGHIRLIMYAPRVCPSLESSLVSFGPFPNIRTQLGSAVPAGPKLTRLDSRLDWPALGHIFFTTTVSQPVRDLLPTEPRATGPALTTSNHLH